MKRNQNGQGGSRTFRCMSSRGGRSGTHALASRPRRQRVSAPVDLTDVACSGELLTLRRNSWSCCTWLNATKYRSPRACRKSMWLRATPPPCVKSSGSRRAVPIMTVMCVHRRFDVAAFATRSVDAPEAPPGEPIGPPAACVSVGPRRVASAMHEGAVATQSSAKSDDLKGIQAAAPPNRPCRPRSERPPSRQLPAPPLPADACGHAKRRDAISSMRGLLISRARGSRCLNKERAVSSPAPCSRREASSTPRRTVPPHAGGGAGRALRPASAPAGGRRSSACLRRPSSRCLLGRKRFSLRLQLRAECRDAERLRSSAGSTLKDEPGAEEDEDEEDEVVPSSVSGVQPWYTSLS